MSLEKLVSLHVISLAVVLSTGLSLPPQNISAHMTSETFVPLPAPLFGVEKQANFFPPDFLSPQVLFHQIDRVPIFCLRFISFVLPPHGPGDHGLDFVQRAVLRTPLMVWLAVGRDKLFSVFHKLSRPVIDFLEF